MTDPIRVKQLDRAWVEQASPSEVADALSSGCLAELMGADAPVDAQATAVRDGYLAEAAEARAEAERLRRAPQPTPGQGSDRGPSTQGPGWREQQLAELNQLSPAEISRRFKAGEYADLLNPNLH